MSHNFSVGQQRSVNYSVQRTRVGHHAGLDVGGGMSSWNS